MIRFSLAFLMVLASPACSSNNLDVGTSSTFYCDNRNLDSTCADYPAGATSAEARGSCDGILSGGACPRGVGVVGTCSALAERGPLVGKRLTNVYYDSGATPRTTESARATCEKFGGTFSAP